MEILYSNVGTTKPCENIFMELKFNDILAVFHNEKNTCANVEHSCF